MRIRNQIAPVQCLQALIGLEICGWPGTKQGKAPSTADGTLWRGSHRALNDVAQAASASNRLENLCCESQQKPDHRILTRCDDQHMLITFQAQFLVACMNQKAQASWLEGATTLRKCLQATTCAKGPSCDKRHPSQGGYADDRVNSWLTGNVVIDGGLGAKALLPPQGGPASARHPSPI
jgi:hypothetical protein